MSCLSEGPDSSLCGLQRGLYCSPMQQSLPTLSKEEPAFDTFTSAIFLTCSDDQIWRCFLAGGGWSVTELSLSEEERVGVGLATHLPFPLARHPEW